MITYAQLYIYLKVLCLEKHLNDYNIYVRPTASEPLCVIIVYQCDTLVNNTNVLYFGDGQAHSCI